MRATVDVILITLIRHFSFHVTAAVQSERLDHNAATGTTTCGRSGAEWTALASMFQPIDSDSERYRKALSVFSTACYRGQRLADFTGKVFHETVLGKLVKVSDDRYEMRMLGVGSGNG